MLDRAWGGAFRWGFEGRSDGGRRPSRAARRPRVEVLEGRQLLAASIAPINPVTVPSTMGLQVPINGSGAGTHAQTFTVTSDNPDVKVSVARGQFMTFNLTHAKAAGQPTDVAINGAVTFQLFEDLTPLTARLFESFVNVGYYNGKNIHRIADFGTTGAPSEYVYQGGSPTGNGTGNSGLPGTPYGLELNQQLAFVQPGALAVAHSSLPNSNDTQFFVTNGTPAAVQNLDYAYTIFGQQVAGFDINNQLARVATTTSSGLGEKSQPISPVLITSATLSASSPNGVIHVDATGARPGETANVTVRATDVVSGGPAAVQTFHVTVSPNTTPPPPATFTFSPLASPVTQKVVVGTPASVQLVASTNNPNNPAVKTVYSLVTQPAHGTVTNFNTSTGTFTYTPARGFLGTDTLSYRATNVGGSPASVPGNTSTVTFNVGTTAAPTASPVTVQGTSGQPVTVQLVAANNNPGDPAVKTTFALVTQPAHGKVTNFNANTGTLTYTPTAGFKGADVFSYRATNVGGTPASVPGNISTVTVNVNNTLPPTTAPVTVQGTSGQPVTVQLVAANNNPNNPAVKTTFALVTQPAHGKVTNFNAGTGTLTYTPNAGFVGLDTFQFRATNVGGSPASVVGNTSTVAINVGTTTGTVRVVGTVLVVTPPPTLDSLNTVDVTQTTNPVSPANEHILVAFNGVTDSTQPLVSSIDRVVVYGAKGNDVLKVDPLLDPTIRVTLDGGHGGRNVLTGGRGPTREHGWFGQNTLIGGAGPNQLIGRAGHVRFKPSAATNRIFAGAPHPGYHHYMMYHNRVSYQIQPPGGTFYKFVNGKLVPVPTPKPPHMPSLKNNFPSKSSANSGQSPV